MNLEFRSTLAFFAAVIFLGSNVVDGVKILIFIPGLSNSHILFNYRFSAALVAKGHSVTLWNMLDLPLKNTNLSPPSGVEEFRVVIDLATRNISGTLSPMDEFVFKELAFKDYKEILTNYRRGFAVACEMQLKREDLIEELSRRKFDLVLSHGFAMCPLILSHEMGVGGKFTFVTPGTFIMDHIASTLALPSAPSYIPNSMRSSSGSPLQIWRFDGEVPEAEGVPHLHIVKWLPQRDLLNHPKIKLFVTHGGYNSLLEATKAGVPLVMIPLFADQYGNGARAQRHGLGLLIEKSEVTTQSMLDAMTTVLNNEQYAAKAKKLALTLNDKVVDPGVLLNHRINFLAKKLDRFPSLRGARTKSLIQYYSLDVLAMFSAIILAVLYGFIKAFVSCLRMFQVASKKRKMKRK